MVRKENREFENTGSLEVDDIPWSLAIEGPEDMCRHFAAPALLKTVNFIRLRGPAAAFPCELPPGKRLDLCWKDWFRIPCVQLRGLLSLYCQG